MTPNDQALITINDISVRFGAITVLHDLSLDVISGRHIAITGKSGSGKSVLLQVIAGNVVPGRGKISYNFKDSPTNPSEDHQRFIAFAGSKHHFKDLTNTSNFYYQQRFNSSDADNALTVEQYLRAVKREGSTAHWQLDETLIELKLEHLRHEAVIKLSNGETKRLMIAAALLKQPVVLLLDNPLTGLDVEMRNYFNALLTRVANTGVTIVMVTGAHDLPDIIREVAIMDEGQIKSMYDRKRFQNISSSVEKITIDQKALTGLIGDKETEKYDHIVAMRSVNIRYGDKQILNNINWTIKQGERWALLGPNGAGKSTLLSLINGDNPQAYANDIVLFDKQRGSGESIWDIKSKIGFVSPELYQYFPTDNSCMQVIESGFYDTLGLFRPSVKARAELAMKWMQALEIDKYARTLLKNIPASAQRLCLLARALIKNPPLLIFDEPCQGLDEHQQKHFKAVIDAICAISNVTLIYVTHYQHEIPDSVDKVLRLDKGSVVV